MGDPGRAHSALLRIPRPSPVEWLCLVAGIFFTLHYAWLMDDAYIYFRYVDNAVFLGYGLVYNAGEYVEGFSSPLWTLLLLALRSAGLDYWILVRGVGVASFVALWCLLVVVNRRLSPPGVPALNLPLCHLAGAYGATSYFTSGLETPLVQLSAGLYAAFAVAPASRVLQLALGVTPLVRPELLLPLALCGAYAWRRQRAFPAALGFAFLATSGPWLVFRIAYFADLLPVTFYLKNDTDFRQGAVYLADALGSYGLPFLLAGSGALYAAARRRAGGAGTPAPGSSRLLMLLLGASVAAYVAKIGGDAIHYRYLAFSCVLWACAAGGCAEHFVAAYALGRFRHGVAAAAILVLAATAAGYPAQLDRHPFGGREQSRIVRGISDASLHRRNPDLSPDPWTLRSPGDQREAYARFLETRGDVPYRTVKNGWWCWSLYRSFDTRVIHGYGLTDPILARTAVGANRPGHRDGLWLLSYDLVRLKSRAGPRPRAGLYRRAVENESAPAWIAENLERIERIERKTYNRHDLLENLELAFDFPGPVDASSRFRQARESSRP